MGNEILNPEQNMQIAMAFIREWIEARANPSHEQRCNMTLAHQGWSKPPHPYLNDMRVMHMLPR